MKPSLKFSHSDSNFKLSYSIVIFLVKYEFPGKYIRKMIRKKLSKQIVNIK